MKTISVMHDKSIFSILHWLLELMQFTCIVYKLHGYYKDNTHMLNKFYVHG